MSSLEDPSVQAPVSKTTLYNNLSKSQATTTIVE